MTCRPGHRESSLQDLQDLTGFTMQMSSVLSIDVGTSGVRAALFDERGNEVPGAQVRSRRSAPVSNFAELDPDHLVNEVINTIDQLKLSNTKVDLIAISAFWHSLLGIDSAGRPTTSLLTWADTRAAQFANDLRLHFNEPQVHARTGCRFHQATGPQNCAGSSTSKRKTSTTRAAGSALQSIFASVSLVKALRLFPWHLRPACLINKRATGTGISFTI